MLRLKPAGIADDLDLGTIFDFARQPGYYSASAKIALLRRAKRQPYDELLVDFREKEVQIGMRSAGMLLAEGRWTWQANIAGQPLTPNGPWQESCWHRNSRSDYLELELKLSAGWRLERQVLLARRDRFLFLGDALIGPSAATSAELRYTSALPLAHGISWLPAPKTREGCLVDSRKRRTSVVPLALTEWKDEYSHSEFAFQSAQLSLQQAALGRALYAPLWIDLDPARARRPITWRKLTVAENLEPAPRDVAVAYRVQVGKEQWLFYRSLAPRGNRTFLGQNYTSEFVCCRFLPSGEADEIVAIENE